MGEKVRYEQKGNVGWVAIDRPEVLNAIDKETLDELLAVVKRAGQDDETAVLVITGVGRAFSVGGDIKHMMADPSPETFRATGNGYQLVAQAMRDLGKPIIAAINGYCLGGGLEIALMCDLRIAAASAKLGLPDAVLGFSPTGGLTHLLSRLIGLGRAMHMALVPDPIDATESERIGLVNQVIADEKLHSTALELAQRMTTFPPHGLAFIKRGFYLAADTNFAGTLALEEEVDVACFVHPDTQKALSDFLESRKKK